MNAFTLNAATAGAGVGCNGLADCPRLGSPAAAPWLVLGQILWSAAMDSLPTFAQPQLVAGILAITLLGLAAAIEVLMLGMGLRQRRLQQPSEPPAAPPIDHDFYDWLYE